MGRIWFTSHDWFRGFIVRNCGFCRNGKRTQQRSIAFRQFGPEFPPGWIFWIRKSGRDNQSNQSSTSTLFLTRLWLFHFPSYLAVGRLISDGHAWSEQHQKSRLISSTGKGKGFSFALWVFWSTGVIICTAPLASFSDTTMDCAMRGYGAVIVWLHFVMYLIFRVSLYVFEYRNWYSFIVVLWKIHPCFLDWEHSYEVRNKIVPFPICNKLWGSTLEC